MSAMNPYRTLRQFASDEFIINKSRFIGYAAPCETEAEALAFLQSIRTKHKDATHNCYAYIIGQNAGIMRYSDDGEPGGTAGLPMMEVLKHQGVVNCCCARTRRGQSSRSRRRKSLRCSPPANTCAKSPIRCGTRCSTR